MKRTTLLSCLLLERATAFVDQFSSPNRLTGSSFGVSGRNRTFDYVVIGGGTAGSVVATRLSQYNHSVALIEAGSFYELTNGNLSQVPFFSDEGIGGDPDDWQPQVDWGLVTEPQVNDRRYHYAQGKALGGSSARNSMLYHWPTKGSYDAWAEEVGDDSFRWEKMQKYLRRSVRLVSNSRRDHSGEPVEQFEFGNGPLSVSMPAYVSPLSAYGADAFSAIGLGERASLFNGSLEGFGWWTFTIDPETGLRSSAETSFLSSELQRKESRLTIYTGSLVRKIVFQNNTATGVIVTSIDGKKPFILSARKEVILAAGVWHSPQLLMVSGVGDRSVLSHLRIPTISHLTGVGQNVHDSCYLAGPVYQVSTPGPAYWRQSNRLAEAAEEFLDSFSGPLTNIGLDLAVWDNLSQEGRSNFSNATQKAVDSLPTDWPLVEYSLSSMDRSGVTNDQEKHYGTIDCVLVATQSRGNITIDSASNLNPPIINPNWLQDTSDQEMAVKAYRKARKAWTAIPDDVRLGEELFPGPHVTTDEELLDAIKSVMGPIHHASSSCKMGKSSDPEAVVNSRGQVYGVRNLRIVDASSFPFTPPGHIQAVTYAHAEKLADDILETFESTDDTPSVVGENESFDDLSAAHADL